MKGCTGTDAQCTYFPSNEGENCTLSASTAGWNAVTMTSECVTTTCENGICTATPITTPMSCSNNIQNQNTDLVRPSLFLSTDRQRPCLPAFLQVFTVLMLCCICPTTGRGVPQV